jgi:hypothetical protein
MHGCRGFEMPRPAAADCMVHRWNVKNARYVLVNLYVFFFGFRPVDHLAGKLLTTQIRYWDLNSANKWSSNLWQYALCWYVPSHVTVVHTIKSTKEVQWYKGQVTMAKTSKGISLTTSVFVNREWEPAMYLADVLTWDQQKICMAHAQTCQRATGGWTKAWSCPKTPKRGCTGCNEINS